MSKFYLVDATIQLVIETDSEEEAQELAGEEMGSLDSFVTAKTTNIVISTYMEDEEKNETNKT